MNMREQIAKANALRPGIIEETVEVNGEKIKAKFRRLSYIELDKLRLHAIGASGLLDKNLHVGSAGRTIAKMLCDETGAPCFTEDEIALWDDLVVKAFADVCAKINKNTPDAVQSEVKNFAATNDDAVS